MPSYLGFGELDPLAKKQHFYRSGLIYEGKLCRGFPPTAPLLGFDSIKSVEKQCPEPNVTKINRSSYAKLVYCHAFFSCPLSAIRKTAR